MNNEYRVSFLTGAPLKDLERDNTYTGCQNRYNIVTGGTDCHIVHVDLKRSPVAISGAKGELVLEEVDFFLTNPQQMNFIWLLSCIAVTLT